MSGPMNGKGVSRRSVTIGGGIAAALGLGALGITLPRLLTRRYRQSPYDDLLAQLIDREAAIRVGKAAALRDDAATLAHRLRPRLERRTLAEVTNSDIAQGRLIEVQGWVLPETLVLLSALAALES